MKFILSLAFFISPLVFSAPYDKARALENPRRDISIIHSDEGYYPKSISAFVGEDLRITLTSIASKASCLVLENHKLYMAANKGKLSMDQVRFTEPGVYRFYCPANDVVSGKIIVLEKKNEATDRKRGIASEFRGHWRPRDF